MGGPTMHKQLKNGVDGDHAARQRSYLHEELGPGGGVLHHAVHHTDESLTLTHLQQRKEQTIQTQTHRETSPHARLCLLSRKQERTAPSEASSILCLALPITHPL